MADLSFQTTTASAVAGLLGRPLLGPDAPIRRQGNFPPAEAETLSFCGRKTLADGVVLAPDSTVIALPQHAEALRALGAAVIASDHPKYDFARAVRALMAVRRVAEIHPTAIIGADVRLGQGVAVGAYATISGDVTIGDGCSIGNGVRIAGRVQMGRDVVIYDNAVLGSDPFSFGFGPGHEAVRVIPTGRVILGDGAEIGNNVVVAIGVFDDTVIGPGCRVNDLAMIGNSVKIGRNSLVMASVGVAARVVIGERCWIAQGSNLLEGVRVGDGAQVGMGAVVVDDVAPQTVVVGSPARFLRNR